ALIHRAGAGAGAAPAGSMTGVKASGTEAAAAMRDIGSPENYIGYARADRFVSPGALGHDQPKDYALVPLSLNDWALEGRWIDGRQSARSLAPGARISFRFHARDLHLVLGSATGKPVGFRVTIDGHAPGPSAGVDVSADGA